MNTQQHCLITLTLLPLLNAWKEPQRRRDGTIQFVVDVVVMIISTVGVLAGVVLGGLLSARAQSRVWRLGEAERLRHERRRIYAEFLSAARIWRAAIMSPSAVIVEVSTFSRQRHADGGDAAIDVLRLRFEVGLIALTPEMTQLATLVFRAARNLAEARARFAAGAVPDEILDQCRQAERAFAAAARSELGGPPLDG